MKEEMKKFFKLFIGNFLLSLIFFQHAATERDFVAKYLKMFGCICLKGENLFEKFFVSIFAYV